MDRKLVLFFLLMMCLLLCVFALSLLQPFFPPFAKERGVSDYIIGIIFGINPLGAMCVSIPVTKYLNRSNQFKFMFCGLSMQSLGLLMFAYTYFLDRDLIIIFALTARLINGIGMCFFMNPLYAAIPFIYPESIVQKIAITNIFVAQGFMFGPAIGSFLYAIGGYWFPFLFFGVIPIILIPTLNIFIQKIEINEDYLEISPQNQKELNTGLTQITLDNNIEPLELIKSYHIMIYTFTIFLVNFQFNFFGPIISIFFIEYYDSTESDIGWFIAYMNLFYIIAGFFGGSIKQNQNKFIFISALTSGFGCILLGPDYELTGIQRNFIITLIAYAIIGGSAAIMQIYILTLLNQVMQERFPKSKDICNNIASGIYTSGTYMGELLGPIISGFLSSFLSLERTISCLGFIFFIYSLFLIPILNQQKQFDETKIEENKKYIELESYTQKKK